MYTEIMSPMEDADLTQLTTDFTTLMNSYQALLYTMAKIESMSLLNYLK
jgi:flagellin-like hook-associated protein FlgL